MRKSKLNKMSTANGKIWDNENEKNSLNQLGVNLYAVASVDEYKNELIEMNSIDLQRHATEVGEIPRDNREILIKNLLTKFREVNK